MRVVKFSESVSDRQSYDLFLISLYNDQREHSRQELKKIGVLQDLVESVSAEVGEGDEDGYAKGSRRLAKQPCELIFEEDQYDRMKQTMEAMKWRAGAAKIVTAAFDLLESAEHMTAKELEERKTPLTLA